MNPVLDQIYASGKVMDEAGELHDAFPAAVSREDGMALYDLVRLNGARRTLETGMAFGVATLAICQGLSENEGGLHTSIDPWQDKWFNRIGLANVNRAGFASMHRFIEEPSYLALPRLLEAGERFDFVFVDGNHRFEYILLDLFYAQRMLEVGGRIVFHDMWMPSVRKAIAFIVRNLPASFELDPCCVAGIAPRSRGLLQFCTNVRHNPWDLFSARYFARKRFFNYAVFRKTAEHEPQHFDQKWDVYTPF